MSEPAPSTQEIDAPRVVSNVTREVLHELATAINATTTRDEDHVEEYSLQAPGAGHWDGVLTIKYRDKPHRDSPNLEVRSVPEVGSGMHLSVTAPIGKWTITQTVDDHNLLTELHYRPAGRAAKTTLSIYGPPAKLGASEIFIDGEPTHPALIDNEFIDE